MNDVEQIQSRKDKQMIDVTEIEKVVIDKELWRGILEKCIAPGFDPAVTNDGPLCQACKLDDVDDDINCSWCVFYAFIQAKDIPFYGLGKLPCVATIYHWNASAKTMLHTMLAWLNEDAVETDNKVKEG